MIGSDLLRFRRRDSCLRSIIWAVLVYLGGMHTSIHAALREEIAANYRESSAAHLAAKYRVSLSTVYTIAYHLGVTSNQRWGAEKEGIIADYRAGIPIKRIAHERGHSHGNVLKRLKEWGVTLRTPTQSKMQYDFDTTYFKAVDSHEKAYWLGFIYADGNVYRSDAGYKHVFQIHLAAKDNGHLSKLRAALKDSRPLYPDNGGERYMINHIDFVKDLMALGVTPRKSLTTTFPSTDLLPNPYVNSFLLGYFDGDGSISLQDKGWHFSVIGTHEIVDRMRRCLTDAGLPSTRLRQEKRKADGTLWYLTYGGTYYTTYRSGCESRRQHSLLKLYRYLYADSPVWLDRKRTLFESGLTRLYDHDWQRLATIQA